MFELTSPSKHHSLATASVAGFSAQEIESDFRSWVRDHEEELYRFALHRVGDSQLAEDLVQETMLAGWRAQRHFHGHSKVSTWLFSILRNKITDHFRSKHAVRLASELPSEELDSATQVNGTRSALSTRVDRDEFWAELHACLDRLPTKLAIAFRLKEIDGKSTAETCAHLHISPTNLSMRLHRARIALQKQLSRDWLTTTK
ncbi:MAG: sigma-70 family RNA polymerase sigma factor [Aureliella sp.]